MSETEFQIVDRSHIPQRGGRGRAPSDLTLALARGDVVFVPAERGKVPPGPVLNAYAKGGYLRLRGLTPHSRRGIENGVDGVYLWADRDGAPR